MTTHAIGRPCAAPPRMNAREHRSQPQRKTSGMRRLIVRGEEWRWGYGSTVRIQGPDGRRHDVSITTFSGMSHHELERAAWKRPAFDLTPRRMRDWIDRHILGYHDATGMPEGVLPRDWVAPISEIHRPVVGPRGVWQWRLDQPDVEIVSPEQVATRHRVYDVTGQGVEGFFAAQYAMLAAGGLDPVRCSHDVLPDVMRHPMHEDARPKDADVLRFIEALVAGSVIVRGRRR